jgi:hypothetical protein
MIGLLNLILVTLIDLLLLDTLLTRCEPLLITIEHHFPLMMITFRSDLFY